jgi:hypothetical protein
MVHVNAERPSRHLRRGCGSPPMALKLGMANKSLAAVIGVSEATVSRMRSGAYTLQRGQKSFELATLFVRFYRSLDAIVGGDQEVARAWLKNPNTSPCQRPAHSDPDRSRADECHLLEGSQCSLVASNRLQPIPGTRCISPYGCNREHSISVSPRPQEAHEPCSAYLSRICQTGAAQLANLAHSPSCNRRPSNL